MAPEQAETIALQLVGYVVAQEDLRNALFAQTGLEVDNLKERLNDTGFLSGVLDFILMDEQSLIHFCNEVQLTPEIVVSARRALPGGQHLWDG